MGYTKTGDPFVCVSHPSTRRFTSFFADRLYPLVGLLFRLAQYYLSPKKSMRENMKGIIFQLDIRGMVCLGLLDGMSFFSVVRRTSAGVGSS